MARSKDTSAKQKRPRTKPSHVEYTTEQKIRAIVAMRTVGQEHPYGALAITAAQGVVGAPVSVGTLKRWMDELGPQLDAAAPGLAMQPVDMAGVGLATRNNIVGKMYTILDKLLDHMVEDKTINEMAGRDTSVSSGIFIDKLAKLFGVTPEEEQLVRRLRAVCQRDGLDHLLAFEDYIVTLEAGDTLTVGESA